MREYTDRSVESHSPQVAYPAGLHRFPLRDATPEAKAALASLRARGWFSKTHRACDCGRIFFNNSLVVCPPCRERCSHRALRGYIIQINGRGAAHQYCGYCGTLLPNLKAGNWIYNICFKDNRDALGGDES